MVAGDSGRKLRALERLDRIQERLQDDSEDRSLVEIYAGLSSGAVEERLIAEGALLYLQGLDLLRAFDLDGARKALESADRSLQGMPALQAWARYGRAIADYQIGSASGYRGALDQLEAALVEIEGRPYPLVRGRIHYQTALTHGVMGNHSAALAAAEDARGDLVAGGDPAALARVEELVAHEQRILGQRPRAWSGAHRALLAANEAGSIHARYNALFSLTILAREEGWHRAELVIAQALVESGRALDNPVALAPALKERARARDAVGDGDGARLDLERAGRSAAALGDPSVRNTVEADLRLAAGEILLATEPDRACRDLDDAVASYRDSFYRLYLPPALRLRARCRRSRGDHDGAARDLAEAIAALETQRGEVSDAASRGSFFDEARELFGAQIALLAEQGEWANALLVADQGRSRLVLDRLAEDTWPDGRELLDRVGSSLSSGDAIVSYFLGSDAVYAWVLTDSGLWGGRVATARGWVEDEIRRLREGLSAGAGSTLAAAHLTRLHRLLLGPLEEQLRGAERLFVVLDGPLHQLPFSALREPRSGRYLFEDREVQLAPSLAVLASSLGSRRGPSAVSTLVIAGEAPRGWARLVAAESEARRVAEHCGGARLVFGAPEEARVALHGLGDYSGLHFAGHARTTALDPQDNGLILGDGPLFTIAEIAETDASGLDLVVLSACGTARGPIGASEGMQGLARAFIAAGAGSVVASLWDVNDESTANFVIDFYRELETTGDPARALGRAKSRALRDGVPFATWAAFEVYSARAHTETERTAP